MTTVFNCLPHSITNRITT